MKTLLFGLFCCCAVRLAFGAPGHTHEHAAPGKDDTYKITLHINSGKEDPHWTIPDNKQLDPERMAKIIKLLNLVGHGQENKEMKTGGTLPSKNGYKGITVEHFDAKGKSLHKWTMAYCTSPILEWNLVIKTAANDVVSLEKKRLVHETLLTCLGDKKKTSNTSTTTNTETAPATQ